VPAAWIWAASDGGGLGADVQDQVVRGHVGSGLDGGHRVGLEFLGHHHVHRDGHGGAARLHGGDHGLGGVQQVGLGQALADGQAFGQHEGVGDAAADDQAVDLAGQRLQDGQLGADLAAGHDGHQRPLRVGQRLGDGVDLGRQQRAGAGDRGELGNAVGAGFGAVRGAEGVVHEDVAQRGHLARQRSSFFFSPLLTRQFSSSTTWPGLTSTPSTQLATSGTGQPSSSARRAATGARLSSGLNWPSVGRPRCEVTITAAPASSAMRMAGTLARTRVSSVMRPAVVLRHVQVGADEDTFAGHASLVQSGPPDEARS
jgi:hypothetical protein